MPELDTTSFIVGYGFGSLVMLVSMVTAMYINWRREMKRRFEE